MPSASALARAEGSACGAWDLTPSLPLSATRRGGQGVRSGERSPRTSGAAAASASRSANARRVMAGGSRETLEFGMRAKVSPAPTSREPPPRLLFGPGPSNVEPAVTRALAAPLVGHLDPYFLEVMDETMRDLRSVFRTASHHTIPMSGTGSAGLETIMLNLLEPGDEVIVGVIGYFGQRLAEMAGRAGAVVRTIEAPLGEVIAPERVAAELKRKPAKLVALVAMLYAFREALRLVVAEGLEARWARHPRAHEHFARGLDRLGLQLFTPAAHRLPQLNLVRIPDGVDDARVRRALLDRGIEIAGGFGPLKGKTWRVGLMGVNADTERIDVLLGALEEVLVALR